MLRCSNSNKTLGSKWGSLTPSLKGDDGKARLPVHEYPMDMRSIMHIAKGLHEVGDEVTLILFGIGVKGAPNGLSNNPFN